jgi:excisionase family DNA binding protein
LKILFFAEFSTTKLAKTMPSSQAENVIMTIGEVANYLKVTDRSIYRLAGVKKITVSKVGGNWRFSKIDINLCIRGHSFEHQPSMAMG